MSEQHLVAAILAKWGAHPRIRMARINTGAAKLHGRFVRFNPPGTADIVGLIAPMGRMLMIECKSPTGKQRAEQLTMQKVVDKLGGLYILARQVEDVDVVLTKELCNGV